MRSTTSIAVALFLAVLVPLAARPAPASSAPGTYAYRGSAGSPESLTLTTPASDARAIEAVFRPLAGSAGSAGLVLDYQGPGDHYLFLFSTSSSALMIFRKLGGAYTLLASEPFTSPFGEEHLLRGESDGAGGLTLSWDDVPRVTAQDASFGPGAVGLRVWNMTADFDDVRVEDGAGGTLLFDDFEDGDDDGWSPGGGWTVVQQGGAQMPTPTFDTSFEGGNAEITFVDPTTWTVHVRPELKGSSPYRAWFYFEMSNLSSAQPTTLVFQSASFFTTPWYSYDRETWSPLPGSGSTYSITFTEERVWIAHSIPYVTADAARLVSDVEGPYVQVERLATSEGGRPVDVLHVTAPGGGAEKCGVWLLGRHHAWEASGSWVADGFVRWLVSSDPRAAELRLAADFHVVPIMDVDNVVLGGSGKDQLPIDFNRDWRDGASWEAVRAAIAAIDDYARTRSYDLFIDSHCPGSATTFLAVQPQATVPAAYWSSFNAFRQKLAESSASYGGSYVEWGPGYHPLWYQMSFWHQYDTHPELELSLTLETAVGSRDSYRDLARGLGLAIARHLECARTGPRRGVASFGPR